MLTKMCRKKEDKEAWEFYIFLSLKNGTIAQDIIRMLNYYNISATIINATYSCSVEKLIVSAINLEMISDHFVVFKMYAKLLGVIGKWWKI